MHLVGFIIRIYHDVRSSECQIKLALFHANKDVYYIPIMSRGRKSMIKPPTLKICSSLITVYSYACRLNSLAIFICYSKNIFIHNLSTLQVSLSRPITVHQLLASNNEVPLAGIRCGSAKVTLL